MLSRLSVRLTTDSHGYDDLVGQSTNMTSDNNEGKKDRDKDLQEPMPVYETPESSSDHSI